MKILRAGALGGVLSLMLAIALGAAETTVAVGGAKVDITPELPIRLAGYQSRLAEATRVEASLSARALAIGSDADGPVVIVTADVIAVSETMMMNQKH